MPKEPKTLDDLFHDSLRDIYFAEQKILTALPKMATAAQSEARILMTSPATMPCKPKRGASSEAAIPSTTTPAIS